MFAKGMKKIENWLLIESDSWTGKITLLILFKPLNYVQGWSVGLGQEGVAWGGTVWNILKGGGTGGERKQRFLKGGGTSWVKGGVH